MGVFRRRWSRPPSRRRKYVPSVTAGASTDFATGPVLFKETFDYANGVLGDVASSLWTDYTWQYQGEMKVIGGQAGTDPVPASGWSDARTVQKFADGDYILEVTTAPSGETYLDMMIQDATFRWYVLDKNPVAYYRLNETSGLPQDSSGNGSHMNAGGASIVRGIEGAIVGDDDTAMRFPVSNAVDRTTGLVVRPVTHITVAVSVKMAGTAANWCDLVNHGWTSTGSFNLYESATGLNFGVINASGAQRNVTTSIIPRDDQYHRIVGVYDGTDVKLYVDGVLKGTTPISGAPTLYTGTTFRIGRMATSSDNVADIDELAVFDDAWVLGEVETDWDRVNTDAGLNDVHATYMTVGIRSSDNRFEIAKYLYGVGSTVDFDTVVVASGDKIGVRKDGNDYSAYHKSGAGAWSLVLGPITDANFARGMAGFETNNTVFRSDLFEYRKLPSDPFDDVSIQPALPTVEFGPPAVGSLDEIAIAWIPSSIEFGLASFDIQPAIFPPPGKTYDPRTYWTVLLFDLNGRLLRRLTSLTARSLSYMLVGIDQASFTMPLDSADAPYVTPLTSVVKIWRRSIDGDLAAIEESPDFCGVVAPYDESGDGNAFTFTAFDPRWRLKFRFLRDSDRLTFSADQSQIILDLLEYTNGYGHTMILPGPFEPTVVRTFDWEIHQEIYKLIEDLTTIPLGGVDLAPKYIHADNEPYLMRLGTGFPRGVQVPSGVRFDYRVGMNNCSNFARNHSAEPGEFATHMTVLGALIEDAQLFATKIDTALIDEIGLYERIDEDEDANTFALLEQLAASKLRQANDNRFDYSLTLSPIMPPRYRQDFQVGDFVPVAAKKGRMELDGILRVYEATLTHSDNNLETCDITVAPEPSYPEGADVP